VRRGPNATSPRAAHSGSESHCATRRKALRWSRIRVATRMSLLRRTESESSATRRCGRLLVAPGVHGWGESGVAPDPAWGRPSALARRPGLAAALRRNAGVTPTCPPLRRSGTAPGPPLTCALRNTQHYRRSKTQLVWLLLSADRGCAPGFRDDDAASRSRRAVRARRPRLARRRKRLSRIPDNCFYPDFPVIPTWGPSAGGLRVFPGLRW
jgi:hypothetical protein